MVVPFPAGGPTDGMARIISDRLGAVLGQSIVIENRGGGAGGSIGAKLVAAADPDGYTILITPGGALTTGPAVYKNIGYDPAKVFAPVGLVIETPQIISVHPDLPVKSLAELVAYAKANPGKISWGSQGFGTAPHLFARNAQARRRHQHRACALSRDRAHAHRRRCRRGPDGRRPDDHQPAAYPIRAGCARWQSPAPNAPRNCPTCRPRGRRAIRSCVAPFWLGVVAPAGTPPAIIDKLNAAFRESLAPPDTRARLATLGAEIKVGTPQDSASMLAQELALWTGVVKAANITVE